MARVGVREFSSRRTAMPLINVKMIEGVFSSAQKQDIIRKRTDTMVSIEGENLPRRRLSYSRK
jgi:hypothetical protein